MNTVQDRQMQDVQDHHKYSKLLVSNAVAGYKIVAIVAVVENENHFVVEIGWNQIDDIVYDDYVIAVDDAAVIDDDDDDDVVVVVAAAAVDDERMAVAVEMGDDFVHFVLVVYSFHSIVLLNDH